MAKPPAFRRLTKSDFPEEFSKLTTPLVSSLNPILEVLARAMNKDITFDENINVQIKDIEVSVDSFGVPESTSNFATTLRTKSKGMVVIKAENLIDSTALSGCPFITFEEESGLITVQHVTGLPTGKLFQLTVVSIG